MKNLFSMHGNLARVLFDAIDIPVFIMNDREEMLYANAACPNLLSIEDELSLDAFLNQHQDLKEGLAKVLLHEVETCSLDTRVSAPQEEWYEVKISTIHDQETMAEGVMALFINITKEKGIEKSMQADRSILELYANNSRDMIKLVDNSGIIQYSSPSQLEIMGYEDEHQSIYDGICPDDLDDFRSHFEQVAKEGTSCVTEVRKRNQAGDWVWLEASMSAVKEMIRGTGNILVVSRDISERRKYLSELEFMAYHDFLTGIYNRRKFYELVEESLLQADQDNKMIALLVMDIDHFKLINDTFGHNVGDVVLKEFSGRLLASRGEEDYVGRLSGDEFAVLMRNVSDHHEVTQFMETFRTKLAEPWDLPELEGRDAPLKVSASIGYAIYPEHGTIIRNLLKYADTSLYKQKKRHHATYKMIPRKKGVNS